MTDKRRGFTLVELTMAILFLSILLMAILVLTIQAGKLYVKGVTNKEINQIGRDVTDMLRRDIEASGADKVQFILTPDEDPSARQVGRLCTGTVSYLWNTAALLNSGRPNNAMMMDGSSAVRLYRVQDIGANYCTKNAAGSMPMVLVSALDAREMMTSSGSAGRTLAVYSFTLSKVASTGSYGLYQGALTIGTSEKDTTDGVGEGALCKPPTDNSANFDYCSVASFALTFRAGGSQ